jgi:hypothetical protein
MSIAAPIDHDPLELDLRDCEICGRKLDEHECVDDGDGPQYFCLPDDDIVKLWELADPRDRWRHTGEAPPPAAVRNSIQEWPPKRPYRTAQSTVDAFRYVLRQGDKARLKAWLADHPRDAAFLLKSLEAD